MKIIDVVPIIKGPGEETLSYFTSKAVREGTLVTVPARTKIIPAVVTSVRDIQTEKINVKSANFKLKAIKSVVSDDIFSADFLKCLKEVAKYYASPLGAVVKDFLPEAIFSLKQFSRQKIEEPKKFQRVNRFEISMIQAPVKERVQAYRGVVREEFARGHSVFILFPTVAILKEFAELLQKGIEGYSFTLHSQMLAKNIQSTWKKIISENHPVLIFGTKSYLSIPRIFDTLIIDAESSTAYKSLSRPYTDARKVAEIMAKNLELKLILGDTAVRTETFYREESGEMIPAILAPARLLSEAEQLIVDMKESLSGEKRPFQVLSPELQSQIAEARNRNENIILFVNRRGLSTVIVCHDCYKTLVCEKCAAPLVTHKGAEGQSLLCHKCLESKEIPKMCPYCGSWNMQSYGIGTNTVEDALSNAFPSISIFKLWSDTVKTQRQGEVTAEKFLRTPGSALVATEMLFSFIKEPVATIGVVSIDTLFAFPDFNMNEKIFQLLIRLRLLAKKSFVVQTRMRENPVFDYALRGNISGFFREEIEERKNLGYPPFKQLIKISCASSDKKKLKEEVDGMALILANWVPISYSAFIAKLKGLYTSHILLKLPRGRWPEKEPELYEKLRSLPPSWRIDIDPETLL